MTPKVDAIRALDSVTWYNGLAETVFGWRKLVPTRNGEANEKGYIGKPNSYGLKYKCAWDEHQLQVIWMIAVEMFGNCGTSPRTGWIEDVEGFRQFCLDITSIWRGSEDYRGPKKYFIGDEAIWSCCMGEENEE